jgi:hypothetical protein
MRQHNSPGRSTPVRSSKEAPLLMYVDEAFGIDGDDPHLGGTEERIALQILPGPKAYTRALG